MLLGFLMFRLMELHDMHQDKRQPDDQAASCQPFLFIVAPSATERK